MPFKKAFEKQLNRNLQESSEQGRSSDFEDMDIKTQPPCAEDEDYGSHSKIDQPPRFSTIFGTPPRVEPAPILQREHYAAPRRKSGIWMPWSLFILLAVMLFLESTILFTYTVIGLYNNTPSRILDWAGPGLAYAPNVCPGGPQKEIAGTQQQQPAINFAPNIMIPQAQAVQPTAITITMTQTPTTVTTTFSATTTSVSTSTLASSTASTADASSAAAAMASEVASMLASGKSSSTGNAGVLTVFAPGSVVTETATLSPPAASQPSSQVTVTSVAFVTAGINGKAAENSTSSPTVNTSLPTVLIGASPTSTSSTTSPTTTSPPSTTSTHGSTSSATTVS